MCKISIIVPVYNMERLMRRCIDSLLAQTFTDFECLLIDDGSTDGSPAICDEYATKDPRVHAYHKTNGGLSDARNYGLQRAKGIYTIFCDPDDWVSPEGLDRLYARAEAEQADVTICDIYREDQYARHYDVEKPSRLDHQTALNELFQNLQGYTVNKLIRRELYTKYDISYPKGIYGCEDQYTMAALFLRPVKIAYEPVAFYHYMYNPNSLVRHYDEHTYEMDLHILEMFRELLKDNEAQRFAIENKHSAIFARAFWNGRKYYNNQLFKERFQKYRADIGRYHEPAFVKPCMRLACAGWYHPAIDIVIFLFRCKQMIKQVRYRFKGKR